MKKQLKKYCIYDRMFYVHLTLFIGDVDAFNKYLKHFPEYEGVEANGRGKHIVDTYKKTSIIWAENKDIWTLSHELIHHCVCALSARGVPLTYENDEVLAYYYEMMLKKILKKIK